MRDFRSRFTRSVFMASIIFVLAHGLQTLAVELVAQNHRLLDEMLTLPILLFGFAEGLVYFILGWPIAYAPVYLTSRLRGLPRRRTLIVYAFAGFTLGLIFLPLCAGVPCLVLGSPPSYSFWCIQYAYPMTFAGALGGYAFWRFARRTAQYDQQLVDQFS